MPRAEYLLLRARFCVGARILRMLQPSESAEFLLAVSGTELDRGQCHGQDGDARGDEERQPVSGDQ